MLKGKSKAAEGDRKGGGLVLRVRAEGAQGIAAAGGLLGAADKKPDPYVTFRLLGASRACAHVDDVEPLRYFSWPAAEAEFPVADEQELARGPLEVLVKDKDLLKDRFVGGVDVSLAALLKDAPTGGGGDRVLCQSRLFPLEYADEKRKAKNKPSGEVKLTITLVDSRVKAGEQDQQGAAVDRDATAAGAEQARKPSSAVEMQPSKPPAKLEPVASYEARPAVVNETTTTGSAAPTKPKPSSDRKLVANPTSEASANRAIATPSTLSDGKAVAEEQTPVAASTTAATPASPAVDTNVSFDESRPTPAQVESAVPAASDHAVKPSDPVRIVKRLTVELVSAVNLTRPSSLGALFDRKPDPFVVLEFAGIAQSSTPLKDVDTKQPVHWSGAHLSFELPQDPTAIHRPKGIALMDLLIHVKDENLTKPTYMGGAKVNLEEFFDTSAAQAWTMSSAANNGAERVYPLTFADERMKKRKACGELTVRFHFELLDPPVSPEGEIKAQNLAQIEEQPIHEKQELDPSVLETKIEPAPTVTSAREQLEPAKAVAEPRVQRLTSDVKSLCVEVLCARQLRKPTAPSGLIKGMMKAVFDRKPDPYVVLFMQGQPPQKTAVVQDADVAFVEWKNAAQVYEFSRKPYPAELIVQVRDCDAVGSDPFMGGTRIFLQSIWAEATHSSEQTELVCTYPLVFADEQMTKHQPCGEVTLRFRWVYASEPLPESGDQTSVSASAVIQQDGQQVEAHDSSLTKQPHSHQDMCLLRYLTVDNLRLWNNPGVISASHDLYVEVSCVSRRLPTDIPKQRVLAASRVLTDATKRLKPDEVVEWGDEVLVIPIVVPESLGSGTSECVDDNHDMLIELKDKNAITKDTSIARKTVPKVELLSSCDPKGAASATVKIELEPTTSAIRGKKSASAVALEMRLTLLPPDSPVMVPPQSEAAIMTFFALTGSIDWDSPSDEVAHDEEDMQLGLFAQQASKSSPSTFGGLLSSFSKPHIEDQVDFYPLSESRQSVIWRTGFDTLLSSKQIQTAKEKEAFNLDIQLWCSAKAPVDKKKKGSGCPAPKMVGSYQVDAWQFLSSTGDIVGSKPIQLIQIPLGELRGVMTLSFGVSFRKAQLGATNEKKAGAGSLLAQEPPPGSGNLHLLVLYAQQLVPPGNGASDEKSEELDPEVRVAIEPKYVKRKDNPVRAMLKTRPLENAGVTPTWNEYLRLEYRLPEAQASPDPVAAVVGSAMTTGEKKIEEQAPANLPAPIVAIGVYDIQIVSSAQMSSSRHLSNSCAGVSRNRQPGERSSSSIIGKAELPLSAFALPKCSPSVLQPLPIYMTVDVHLAGKKTGRLTLEGVFEPLPSLPVMISATATSATTIAGDESGSENDEASYRSLCRSVGRSLRDKSKALRTGGPTADATLITEGGDPSVRSVSGRIEVHVEVARGSIFERDDGPTTAYVWLMSALDNRKELKSRPRASAASTGSGSDGIAAEAKWDVQVSLYTADIATDILRVELLSSK